MDINGLKSNYTDYLAQESKTTSQIDQLKNKNYDNASDEELMGACKQFEEYFVEMVLKEVFKTVDIFGMGGESSSGAMSTSKDLMKDSMVQKFATKISEDSNLGLAQQLYESMKRNTISVEELKSREEEA